MSDLKKVTKTQVKSIIKKEGKIQVGMIPCKMNVHGMWMKPYWQSFSSIDEFEGVINSYSYYNCNYEVGSYPSYYVER